MVAAGGVAGESSATKTKGLRVAVIHPDLGIGGAERLIVDAACQLVAHGHDVHVFTSHHDKNRCFEETVSGLFPVTVYGDFLPRHVFYRLHAIVFYCHFPDLLLAQHTTTLRRLYRKPIDMIEEATTGMADLILVNSKFTATTFSTTFLGLHARGIEPAVLYPAVSVEQFQEPHAYKLNFLSINRFERTKNLDLAISAFSLLRSVASALPGDAMQEATLTMAGGYDTRLRENVEYLEELKRLAVTEGVSGQVKFVTSCSTSERNELLSNCLCVLYTPKDEHFGMESSQVGVVNQVIASMESVPMSSIYTKHMLQVAFAISRSRKEKKRKKHRSQSIRCTAVTPERERPPELTLRAATT